MTEMALEGNEASTGDNFRCSSSETTRQTLLGYSDESIDNSTIDEEVAEECLRTSAKRSLSAKPKTVKEYDQQLGELRNENFNLKVRLFLMEEKLEKSHGDDVNTLWLERDECEEEGVPRCKLCEKEKLVQSLQEKLNAREQELKSNRELLAETSQISEQQEIFANKELETMKAEIAEWKRQALENMDIIENLRNELDKSDLELRDLKRKRNEDIKMYDRSKEQLQRVQKELEETKSSYILTTGELESLKQRHCEENKKTQTLINDLRLANSQLQELKGSKSPTMEPNARVDDLHRQLAMSEENVRALVKILEGKDKLLESLMVRTLRGNQNKKGDANIDPIRQLDFLNRSRLDAKEKQVNELRAKLAASEVKLSKVRRVVTDMKSKIDVGSKVKKPESRSVSAGTFRTSASLREQVEDNHQTVSYFINENKEQCSRTIEQRCLSTSVSDNSAKCEGQQNSALGYRGETSSFHEQSPKSTPKKTCPSRPCSTNSDTVTSEDNSILCHKMDLNLPVSVQLVIEKSESMQKIYDVLKETNVETMDEFARRFIHPVIMRDAENMDYRLKDNNTDNCLKLSPNIKQNYYRLNEMEFQGITELESGKISNSSHTTTH